MSQPAWQPPSLAQMQSALPAFRFEEIIGRGGMGAVYKATELSLARAVAIKILPADLMEDAEAFYAERFAQEARTMARLNHPGLVRVFDFGKTADGLLYFVMEYVEGTDLARLIKESGKLAPERALDVAEQMCRALDYAHREGVVHRDIKPANLLLTRDGQVKIADFGLAKQHDAAALGFTKSSVTVGTPDYLAPEAWTPGTALDGRADLFAVGVVLYQMLTGRVPRGLWPLASECAGTDARFDAVIDKAVQPDREARYATAAEMIADLEAIRTTPPQPVKKWRRKWWLLAAGAAAGATIAGVQLLPQKPPARLATHVTSLADSGPGSLREAMENCDVNPGPDTITFAPELAGQRIVITGGQPRLDHINSLPGDGTPVPGGPISIDAGSIPGGITISSSNGLFFGRGDAVSLRGLTFTGALLTGRHALASFGRISVTDCVFANNIADVSGGAFNNMLEGNAEFVRCRFTGNSAANGGAIYNLGTLVLTDCTFTGNKALSSGGAISQDGGTLTMTNCTFTENEATMRGGAIAAEQGTTHATRCTIQKNSASGGTPAIHGGGGLYLTDPAVVNLDGCLVSGNTAASGNGPEVWNQGGTLTER